MSVALHSGDLKIDFTSRIKAFYFYRYWWRMGPTWNDLYLLNKVVKLLSGWSMKDGFLYASS